MIAWRITHLEATASTNDVARALVRAGAPEGTVVVADHQTAGRGRLQRSWHDAPGAALLCSLILRPARATEAELPLYSLLAALAVTDAVRHAPGVAAALRWPNDVVVGPRKLAGVLLEYPGDALIVGIGMNILQRAFPPEISDATSLLVETGLVLDRDHVCADVLAAVDARCAEAASAGFGPMLAAWRARCPMLGTRVTVHEAGRTMTGVAETVADDGALVLDVDGRRTLVYAGDVRVERDP